MLHLRMLLETNMACGLVSDPENNSNQHGEEQSIEYNYVQKEYSLG